MPQHTVEGMPQMPTVRLGASGLAVSRVGLGCNNFGRRLDLDATRSPYSPLANGLLSGKYRRGEAPPEGTRLADPRRKQRLSDERFDVVERLESFAAERGIGLLGVAIGGLAAQPAVGSVIAGATTAEQVRANIKAGEWVPSLEDRAALASTLAGPAAD